MAEEKYDFDVYLDKKLDWCWSAKHEGRTLVIGDGHKDKNSCENELAAFKERMKA